MTHHYALEVTDLHVTYRRGRATKEAVRGASLSIGQGRALGIVGESGSGKSSFCLALLGLAGRSAEVRSERMLIAGEDLRGARESLWRQRRGAVVGYIPQQPMTALAPTVAVGRQLEWHLGPKAIDVHREGLRSLGLDAVIERPEGLPATFSGGQLQRVVIAMATLAQRPRLLIADEPTSTLDATVAATVLRSLDERRAAIGASLLLVSHDLATVAQHCDDVAVMRDGEVVEAGPATQVLSHPAHPYTRELLAALPHHPSEPRPAPAASAPDAHDAPALEVAHAYRYFGDGTARRRHGPASSSVVRAVDDISFSVRPGSIVVVVGESGSGKSTLARVAAGALAPTAGDVRLHGRLLRSERTMAERRSIQLVSQNHRSAMNPRRSVAHALVQAQRAHGIGDGTADRIERAQRLLLDVGLTPDHLSRRPRELSGGEAARVVFARSLLLDPEVLVLDEPTAGLDPRVQAGVLDLLRATVLDRQTAVLMITHELPVAAAVADLVIVMHAGQIVETGPPHDVLTSPSQPYTRRLLASLAPDPRAAPGRHR